MLKQNTNYVYNIYYKYSQCKLEYLSCNNLKYSDDVFRTKDKIKGTKRQSKLIFLYFPKIKT